MFLYFFDFIDIDVFLRIANKYDGNRYVKQFICWNQLVLLMSGQFSNRESLIGVIFAVSKAYQLGVGKHAVKCTLAILSAIWSVSGQWGSVTQDS